MELQAYRDMNAARQLEARTGKFLSNPEVNYEQLWGNRSPAAGQGELTVRQGFDFPSAYARRNRIAQLRSTLYDHEQDAFRQQLLLDAQRLCFEIIYLRKQKVLLEDQLANATQIAAAYKRKFDAGDANVLEYNKTVIELINARTAAGLNAAALAAKLEQLAAMTGGESAGFTAIEYPPVPGLPEFEQLLSAYTDQNPTLRGLEQEIEIDRSAVALNRSLSLPKFAAGYRHDFGAGERFNGFTAGMSIPLFENKNRVKTARAQALYSNTRLQSEKLNQNSGLRQLYDQARIVEESVALMREVIGTHDNINLLRKALDAGQISVITYYTEAMSVYQNRLTLLGIEQQYHDLMARIYRFTL